MKKHLNTIRHLKWRQVYYQVFYRFKRKFKSYTTPKFDKHLRERKQLEWKNGLSEQESYSVPNKFMFLNRDKIFGQAVDWNFGSFGKLWTYNLNYFDFLNQESISVEQGLFLMRDYISKEEQLKDGLEPYPISLRGINWIKFLSKNGIEDEQLDKALFNHYQILLDNLEYHLLGNHLLENGFSLLFGAYYFQDEKLYRQAKKVLGNELREQVMGDGAHFELSPMYHQILLHRLLDCIKLSQSNSWKSEELLSLFKKNAIRMLSWLEIVTYSNGNIPMVNDSAYGIAPSSVSLFNYARSLGIKWEKGKMSSSGYRKFEQLGFEVFMDVGNIGPDYQPGHAHSDTFNFELYVDQQPILVDTGISTYEKNELRQKERETAAHNTVKIGNREQTQVWGGFRVGKRAKVVELEERDGYIKASHNGYYPTLHEREFRIEDSGFKIIDRIKNQKEHAVAHFHFHPSISNIEQERDSIILQTEGIVIFFKGEGIKVSNQSCHIAEGFNIRRSAIKIEVSFNQTLETTIRKVNR